MWADVSTRHLYGFVPPSYNCCSAHFTRPGPCSESQWADPDNGKYPECAEPNIDNQDKRTHKAGYQHDKLTQCFHWAGVSMWPITNGGVEVKHTMRTEGQWWVCVRGKALRSSLVLKTEWMCERFKHFGEKDWKSATMLTHFSFLKGRNKREKYKLCKLTYLSNRALSFGQSTVWWITVKYVIKLMSSKFYFLFSAAGLSVFNDLRVKNKCNSLSELDQQLHKSTASTCSVLGYLWNNKGNKTSKVGNKDVSMNVYYWCSSGRHQHFRCC